MAGDSYLDEAVRKTGEGERGDEGRERSHLLQYLS